jgi:hypothetical protein
LLLAIVGNGSADPSITKGPQPAVPSAQIPAGVISWRLPIPSP